MAACNIQQIISPNKATRGATPSTAPYAGTVNQSDINFFDNFIDSINSITNTINTTNCSDKLKNFAKSQLSMSIGGVRVDPTTVYSWAYDQTNLQTQTNKFVTVANTATNGGVTDFAKLVCQWAQNTSLWLETMLQAAIGPVLKVFQKIQDYKDKLQAAMIDFTTSISRCIITVINDIRNATNRFINRATDFSMLVELMDACPCIKDIVKSLSGCRTDSNGNPLVTSQDIVTCIQHKLHINPTQWIQAINNFVDNTLIGNINNVVNAITANIKIIMDLLYSPIRALAKMFCRLIHTKVNIDYVIKHAGDFKCLLVYTKVYKSDGTFYYGMNIFDIMDTMKMWVNCLSPVCKSFSDTVALGLKNWRDEFKLNTKYWNDVFTLDIYTACSQFNQEDRISKETSLREIYYQGNQQAKKNFTTVLDFMQQVGLVRGLANTPNQSFNSTANATAFNQFPIQNIPYNSAGSYMFYTGVEALVESMVKGLQSVTSSDYYFKKYQELVVWLGRFVKSQELMNLLQSVDTNANVRNVMTFSVTPNSNQDTFIEDDIPEEIYTVPTYKLTNDYNQSSITSIDETNPPTRLVGESLTAYYKRWYGVITV